MNVCKHYKKFNHEFTYIGARNNDEINNHTFENRLKKTIISTNFSDLFLFLPIPSKLTIRLLLAYTYYNNYRP